MMKYSFHILLFFLFVSVWGNKDWEKRVWEKGIKLFGQLEDPYKTLKQIVSELEKNDSDQIESYVNEIFLRLLLDFQTNQTELGEGRNKISPALPVCRPIYECSDVPLKSSSPNLTKQSNTSGTNQSVPKNETAEPFLNKNNQKDEPITNNFPNSSSIEKNGGGIVPKENNSADIIPSTEKSAEGNFPGDENNLMFKFGFPKLFSFWNKKKSSEDLQSMENKAKSEESKKDVSKGDSKEFKNTKNDPTPPLDSEDNKIRKSIQNNGNKTSVNENKVQEKDKNVAARENGRAPIPNDTLYDDPNNSKGTPTLINLLKKQKKETPLSSKALASKNSSIMRFIIDTDCSKDSAVALLVILGAEGIGDNVSVEAITAVHGKTPVSVAVTNALLLLKTMNKTHIPVYEGEDSPIIAPSKSTSFNNSEDFGGTEDSEANAVEDNKAFKAMTELTKRNPGKISIICIGPLTNLALAIKLDSEFLDNVESIFISGGSVNKQSQEFNFRQDPVAVQIVFEALEGRVKPAITVMPSDVAGMLSANTGWKDLQTLQNSTALSLIKQLNITFPPTTNSTFQPTLTVAIALKQLSTVKKQKSVTIDICGETGSTFANDWFSNIEVVTKIVPDNLPQFITKALRYVPRSATT